ncbi:ABC transporter ATP-binding protein [Gordonia humi]|uniref:Branched-chain amino acid transport system ATP-binding protein n=1 Tax=Gordonia humi TaxID=686429 RepID=A0A840ETY6_9ACTN|nr:ABC transporter ATP-binding protein [Gordonia humi]MBB4133828.1 branched-chain amino acid transport system ATP-binding protein [Gordonia humi]
MNARIDVTGLAAGYGGSPVIRGVNFSLAPGEILAVLGPNGAGKSTTMLSLAGLIGRAAGTVTIDGTELSAGHPRRAAKQGVVLVPDDRSLFTTLTTTENLRLAATSREKVGEVLDLFPRLKERLKVPAGVLSGGEQQMLAIGRALVQDPKVLLIDELSMGLAPVIVESLLPILRTVAQTGVAVVLVEQHVSLALRTADRALVLAHGEEVLAGSADELLADPARIEAAYMGATHAA